MKEVLCLFRIDECWREKLWVVIQYLINYLQQHCSTSESISLEKKTNSNTSAWFSNEVHFELMVALGKLM